MEMISNGAHQRASSGILHRRARAETTRATNHTIPEVSLRALEDVGLRPGRVHLVTRIPAKTGTYTPNRAAYSISICKKGWSVKFIRNRAGKRRRYSRTNVRTKKDAMGCALIQSMSLLMFASSF
jgi:hypothetical protein